MKNSHQTRPIFQTILCPFVLFVVKKVDIANRERKQPAKSKFPRPLTWPVAYARGSHR